MDPSLGLLMAVIAHQLCLDSAYQTSHITVMNYSNIVLEDGCKNEQSTAFKAHRTLTTYPSYNESQRLAEKRLPFNVDELKRAAANSINKPESEVKSLQKLAEGGFNRIFEIGMRGGTSVLARLPYPSTLPRRLAVASEVATMDFVRAHGILTPRIFGYSIDENPVGSEHI
jgi:hypothetical protein